MIKAHNLKLGSLFDGIGGFPYAASFFGIEALWASEIIPQAVSVTKRHFPDMEHVGDITKLSGTELPPVDIITFGSPCQGLSFAGKREGFADERSGLFTEAIRIIREMREKTNGKYPRYAIWENVPGALSSGKPYGSDFQAALSAFTEAEIPMPKSGKWANAGMVRSDRADIAWCLYNSQYFGTAQRRRRLFLVADFGGTSAGEILFIPKSLCGYFEKGGTPKQGIAAYAPCSTESPDGGGFSGKCLSAWDVQSRRIHDADGTWPALYSGDGGGRGYCLTPWDTQQARITVGDGVAPTLAGADGGGGRNPCGLIFTQENNTELPAISMRIREGREGGGKGPLLQNDQYLFQPIVEDEPDILCVSTVQPNVRKTKNIYPTLTCYHEQAIICKAADYTHGGDGHICLNDQGGESINIESDGQSPTLRSECHGNLPIICVATGQAKAEILCELCPTITGAAGTSGNNKPYICKAFHQSQDGHLTVSDKAYTLTTACHASARNAPLVMTPKAVAFSLDSEGSNSMLSANPNSGCRITETARTIDTTVPCPSKNQGGIAIVQETYGINATAIDRKPENGGNGLGINKDISPTLTATDRHAVCCACITCEKKCCVVYCLQGSMIGRQDKNGPQGDGINKDISFTLNTVDRHAVCSGVHPPIAGTLCASASGLSRPGGMASETDLCVVYCLLGGKVRRSLNSKMPLQIMEDTSYPLLASDNHVVAAVDCRNFRENEDLSGTLQAKETGGYSLNCQNPVRTGYIVRRLTPTECERLMGFPDGWTKYGHDGKEISDSKRYMMLGNSIAVPCVAYIMQGIIDVLEKEVQ